MAFFGKFFLPWVCLLAGGILIAYIVFRLCRIRSLALSSLMGHVIFLVIFAIFYYQTCRDSQGGVSLLIPLTLDFPASLLFLVLGPYGSWVEFFTVLGVLGSLQYCFLGWIADVLIRKSKDRKEPEGACQPPAGSDSGEAADGLTGTPQQ